MNRTPAQRALDQLLPPKSGRTSAERLRAIAGRALADARRTVPDLTDHQAEEVYSHMLEAALKAALEYDPNRDQGSTNGVPIDQRFSSFAYYRMRQRFIDWYRKNIHDSRPGRSDRRTVSLDDHNHDQPGDNPDFEDLVASSDRIQRWTDAAELLGFDLNSWILDTLDEQAKAVLDHKAA